MWILISFCRIFFWNCFSFIEIISVFLNIYTILPDHHPSIFVVISYFIYLIEIIDFIFLVYSDIIDVWYRLYSVFEVEVSHWWLLTCLTVYCVDLYSIIDTIHHWSEKYLRKIGFISEEYKHKLTIKINSHVLTIPNM